MRCSALAWLGLAVSACSAADDPGARAEPTSASDLGTATASPGGSAGPMPPPIASPAPSSAASSAPAGSAYVAPSGPVANDVSQHATLKAIAASHGDFFRADGTWWSPLDCRAPPPAAAHVSDAAPASPHGRKLYTLQIADWVAYARETGAKAADDAKPTVRPVRIPGAAQAIVKESFEPTTDPRASSSPFVGSVTKDGKTWHAGAPRDLFVMYRPTNAKLATDAGWLYGTVTPDGEVTSAGRVASCMGCHVKAPHGRLFGPRTD